MILAGVDIETTGLLAADHRIIEVYIGLWNGSTKVFSFEQRIDPQRGIAADAQRVHGISASDLIGKPTWDTVGPAVFKVLNKASMFVWHNGDEFDGPFLDQELKRIGLELPKRPAIDTMANGIFATPDGKKPRLSELCFAAGIPYDAAQAHAAAYDVDVMMEAFLRIQSWGEHFQLPALQEGISLAA
ncbi:3'-5' exonuclease [Ancylobacter rudongensis]|uniref:DNA polymerase-3 subunit epsilon n=1 Tax=Ancylobacter rudongensis TaxID=177413 RepID=A0A1G4UQP1_9HYPH|nr:3'-5' exonuclease [Ancylobacter rudongensis]SCW95963.1 DNA polymerase-3 subunit epsilon [Ancylobacter rudongensis]